MMQILEATVTGRVQTVPDPTNRSFFDATAPGAAFWLILASPPNSLRVQDLGWTEEEAARTRARLAAFEEDWEAPGMDVYDAPQG